jgi:hypothetical protein
MVKQENFVVLFILGDHEVALRDAEGTATLHANMSEHESNKTKIELGFGMVKSSLEIFDQTFTSLHPRITSFYYPSGFYGDKS